MTEEDGTHEAPPHHEELHREDQIEQARLVALLRRLDMPLARIAGIVEADGEGGARLLDAYWSEAESRHAERRALAGCLRRRTTGRSQDMAELYDAFAVELVEIPEQLLITETRHALADELPVWIPTALGRLGKAAASCGGIAGHPFVAYHAESSMESDGPAEACVPVGDEAAARAWAAVQPRTRTTRSTRTRREPARRPAVTWVTKAQVAHPGYSRRTRRSRRG